MIDLPARAIAALVAYPVYSPASRLALIASFFTTRATSIALSRLGCNILWRLIDRNIGPAVVAAISMYACIGWTGHVSEFGTVSRAATPLIGPRSTQHYSQAIFQRIRRIPLSSVPRDGIVRRDMRLVSEK
jgi:hypothetical protein